MNRRTFRQALSAAWLLAATVAASPLASAGEHAAQQRPWFQASYLHAQQDDGGVSQQRDLFPGLPEDDDRLPGATRRRG